VPALSLVGALVLVLAGCGPEGDAPGVRPAGGSGPPEADPRTAQAEAPVEPTPSSAEAFRDVEAKSAAEYLAEPRYATADLHRGELLSYACKACHALTPGEKNDLGPSLRGVIGRRAATLPGFEYSDALARSAVVWTPEAIETWLADPAAFVPGTKMKFTGYQSAADRRDVVAYLLSLVEGPGARDGAAPQK
jgi:cytochrome c2